jgi:RES domain-containing protein
MRRADFTDKFMGIPGAPLRGFFFRVVPLAYIATPLSALGSLGGGRYNAAATFQIYYVTEKPDVTLYETRIIDAALPPHPVRPTILFTVEANLQHVVDLTDAATCAALGVTTAELLVNWKEELLAGNVPITQDVGAGAREADIEALIVPSARVDGAKNLAIIVDRLRAGSSLKIDPKDGFADDAILITGTR